MLDFTQFSLTISRTLVACDPGTPATIKFDVTTSPGLVADGEQLYVIDPSSMISAFKTSDVSIDYKDGRFVGFNSSTVDKSGDVVTSLISSASKIAILASTGVPVSTGNKLQYCSSESTTKLKQLKDNKPVIESATTSLSDAGAQLAVLTAQYASKPTEKLRVAIKDKTALIKAGQQKLDALVKTSSAAQEWFVETQVVTWPKTSTKFHESKAFPLQSSTSSKWFQISSIRDALAKEPEAGPKTDPEKEHLILSIERNSLMLGIAPEEFRRRFPTITATKYYDECILNAALAPCAAEAITLKSDLLARALSSATDAYLSLHLAPVGTYGNEQNSRGSTKAEDGIRYRVPAAATLYVCEGDGQCQLEGNQAKPIARVVAPVAQLGAVFNLPFSSPAFASGSVSVTFDDQGRLLHAGLKRDNSSALVAANLAGSAVDQAGGILKARRSAPLAELDQQTKIANARKALADAEASLVKTPASQAAEDLALLETQQKIAQIHKQLDPTPDNAIANQIATAQLEIQLAGLKQKIAADPDGANELAKEQYATQAQLLLGKKAILDAEAAVSASEQALAKAKAGPP